MLELMVAWGRGTEAGGMRGVLFSLLDPLVAGRPFGTVLEAGVSAVCHPRDLERRYDWKLSSLGPGCNLDSLPFQNASFDAILALDGPPTLPESTKRSGSWRGCWRVAGCSFWERWPAATRLAVSH